MGHEWASRTRTAGTGRRRAELSASVKAPPNPLTGLQRTLGNHAMQWLLGAAGLQASREAKAVADPCEQEADRVADQVARVQRDPSQPVSTPMAVWHRADTLPESDPALALAVRGLTGQGSPLPEQVRSRFESQLGVDLMPVRVHTDGYAGEAAQALGAAAFTFGHDVYFAPGRWAPGTDAGRDLLAHELTHVIQQHGVARLQRQPATAITTGTKDDTVTALDRWERTVDQTMGRYRDWLSHNMIRFLADVLQSDKASEALTALHSSFVTGVAEEAAGNVASLGAVELGARFGGRQLARLFLELRHARVLGGIVGFIVGAIVEKLVSDLFDKTAEIIRTTAEQVDKLVTGVVNPIVNANEAVIREEVQELRVSLIKQDLAAAGWERLASEIRAATALAEQAFRDVSDESLYRQLALSTGVYTGREVAAEQKRPVKLPAVEREFGFTMQHRVVETGTTAISVPNDGGTVVIRCKAIDCFQWEDDGGYDPVDIGDPEAVPAWKLTPPPRSYRIELYQTGMIFDTTAGVPRVFAVNQEQYGAWYGLKKGVYHIRVWRSDDHPVALCGSGKYWVTSGT
jgi:hypothetical protein